MTMIGGAFFEPSRGHSWIVGELETTRLQNFRVAPEQSLPLEFMTHTPSRWLERGPVNPAATKRRVFARLSIAVGSTVQAGGILAACFALWASRSAHSTAVAVTTMLLAWVLLYFSSHAIAHWLVGRLVGIRFVFYTVGGTANPEGWPPGLRWIFERLPFLGVQTEKLSMRNVSPGARALMWFAGVTSSAITPTLGALWAWRSGVPWSGWFCLFALGWALGTLASNWTSRTGDYAKARRALGYF
jgi:hypothetical protein